MYYTFRVRKSLLRRIVIGGIAGIFLLICATFIFVSTFRNVNAKTASPQVLNYKSVSITTKDTLWGLAKQYYSEEYGSINDYVDEIKRCNSLTSDNIQAGSSIIIPIYYHYNIPQKE